MHWSFYLVAGLTVGSGIAAMSLRNIVHCALLLTVTFAGLALLYLQLNAQFVALAQVLVYIGAVAILIVFAILLTRSSDIGPQSRRSLLAVASGVLVALAAFATISKAVLTSARVTQPSAPVQFPVTTVQDIGEQLMSTYVLPLEIVALLLTAALIGAAVIALQERRGVE
jgi:NADH-quinone oxidoreductase subunit J